MRAGTDENINIRNEKKRRRGKREGEE